MPASPADTEASRRLAARLSAAILEAGSSHRKLAAAIGVSKQSVTNWTQGRNEPSLRHLRNIARALEVPLGNLLQDYEEEEPGDTEAASLIREFTSHPAGPAMRSLTESAPDLLDLLSRAERYVKEHGEARGKS